MLVGTLAASLLGDMWAGEAKILQGKDKEKLQQVKKQLEFVRIFNAASSFN